jgi:hypothetical protein
MLSKLLAGGCLMAACVAIHVGGLTAVLRWFHRPPHSYWGWTAHFTGIAACTVLLHLIEITVWAVYYRLASALPDLTLALYFSAVTYTTTGYGDVVLPEAWRLVGGIEALTGILMCGWSTGVFFAILNRMFAQAGDQLT